jgi:hypothetical protein
MQDTIQEKPTETKRKKNLTSQGLLVLQINGYLIQFSAAAQNKIEEDAKKYKDRMTALLKEAAACEIEVEFSHATGRYRLVDPKKRQQPKRDVVGCIETSINGRLEQFLTDKRAILSTLDLELQKDINNSLAMIREGDQDQIKTVIELDGKKREVRIQIETIEAISEELSAFFRSLENSPQ